MLINEEYGKHCLYFSTYVVCEREFYIYIQFVTARLLIINSFNVFFGNEDFKIFYAHEVIIRIRLFNVYQVFVDFKCYIRASGLHTFLGSRIFWPPI